MVNSHYQWGGSFLAVVAGRGLQHTINTTRYVESPLTRCEYSERDIAGYSGIVNCWFVVRTGPRFMVRERSGDNGWWADVMDKEPVLPPHPTPTYTHSNTLQLVFLWALLL